MWTTATRITQPSDLVRIDKDNPLTRDLYVAFIGNKPNLNVAVQEFTDPLVSNRWPDVVPELYGGAARFDRAAGTPVGTGVTPGAVSSHSAFLIVRHRNLLSASDEEYLSNRDASNRGFGFATNGAAGVSPNRTFQLSLIHQGVAVYNSTVNISGDNKWVTVGYSDTASSTVRFFANGRFIQSIATGAISTSTSPLQIGSQGPNASGINLHADVALCLWWERRLTDLEHQQIDDNPWVIFTKYRTSVFFSTAAVSGNTISVPAGSLVLSGKTPSILLNNIVRIPAGSLALSPKVPTILNPRTISIPAGSLTLQAFAPNVGASNDQTISVPAGSLTLSPKVPTVSASQNKFIAVPAASLVMSLKTPTILATAHQFISVPSEALTLTGYAPQVSNGVTPNLTPYAGVARVKWGESVVDINYHDDGSKSSSVSTDKTDGVAKLGYLE